MYSTFFDLFKLAHGYSLIWLVLLYIIGYSMKKCDIYKNLSTATLLIIMLMFYIFTVFSNILVEEYSSDFFAIDKLTFVTYISPTILISATIMVTVFSRIKMKTGPSEIVRILAPSAFSIYLVDCHPRVLDLLYGGVMTGLVGMNNWQLLFIIVSGSILIAMAVILVDIVRMELFKICGLDKLAGLIEKLVRAGLEKMIKII